MYEQALKLGGRNALALTELARLQMEQEGATKETIRTLGQAVKLDPKHAPAYLALSDAYVRLGDRRQATRQAQLACASPGEFMRAQLPSDRMSCSGQIARSATEVIATRIKCQEISLPSEPVYTLTRCASRSLAALYHPREVSLSWVPVYTTLFRSWL